MANCVCFGSWEGPGMVCGVWGAGCLETVLGQERAAQCDA